MRTYDRAGAKKGRIMKEFVRRLLDGEKTQITVYELAKSLDMARSSNLQKLMMELVEDGRLTVTLKVHRPGVNKRVFDLSEKVKKTPESGLAREFGGREIVINGRAIGTQTALLWSSQ